MKIVLATGNQHKREEIAEIVSRLQLPLTIVEPPFPMPEVVEDGETLEANAVKKAVEVSRVMGLPALADDTGLEIDHLNGQPGIYAARWAGPECDFRQNVAKALRELQGVPVAERTARFRTVVALVTDPDGEPILAQGKVEGVIAEAERGAGGFGYDPIFYLPDLGKCLAELTEVEKNRLSHRFRALEHLGSLIDR